jgi:hypothetical protein
MQARSQLVARLKLLRLRDLARWRIRGNVFPVSLENDCQPQQDADRAECAEGDKSHHENWHDALPASIVARGAACRHDAYHQVM